VTPPTRRHHGDAHVLVAVRKAEHEVEGLHPDTLGVGDQLAKATLERLDPSAWGDLLEEVEPDGLVFDETTVSVERIAEDAVYEGVRSTFAGNLGNARIAMQIDLGFSDVVTPGPIALTFPTILELPAPELQAYNQETTIAEKFEAMVKLGELNSRMKDFFDIWSLATHRAFGGAMLAEAIAQTFSRRGTAMDADAVCFADAFGNSEAKQLQWQAFLKRTCLTDSAPALFVDVWSETTAFLRPMISPASRALHWPAGGTWGSR